ncbi:UNVERIFIED_CONTAM: putative NAD(P)H dehydrogenase (quinone) FQR1-like 3 [Sesamum angustifolium]|uniref:NAD(P)H dehydrogenase (quinone) n=1 Tax=Sesamum angustifolium TaxID=2727405 RepID=A0AAW2QRX9_9LAMI
MPTTKVYIVYYSLYGHVENMAREIQKGANSVPGVEAILWQVTFELGFGFFPPKGAEIGEDGCCRQGLLMEMEFDESFKYFGELTEFLYVKILFRKVKFCADQLIVLMKPLLQIRVYSDAMLYVPETLPDRVLEKMKAPDKADDVPEIRPEQLVEADGFIFGFPSRFGVMAAQFKAFFDATHEIWATQALAGKPAGIFWSTGFHGVDRNLRLLTRRLTAITQLAHHGMIFVPLGYTFGSGMFEMEQVKGGSSYGAGTYAADGSREPTELELQQSFHQGKYVAEITRKLKT